jgi:integrase/recombinase XerD
VLGDDYLPVKPIHEFIRYLNNIERSPNTLRAYANHLKLYWEYLNAHQKTWDTIKLNDIAEFIFWLRLQNSNIISINLSESKRTEPTINAILTALSSFYDFHKQIGKNVIQLTQMVNSLPRQYKPLLHHISKSKPVKSRLIKIKQRKTIPKTITKDQVQLLIDACHSYRDKFLIYLHMKQVCEVKRLDLPSGRY